jgi:hypothetical protein
MALVSAEVASVAFLRPCALAGLVHGFAPVLAAVVAPCRQVAVALRVSVGAATVSPRPVRRRMVRASVGALTLSPSARAIRNVATSFWTAIVSAIPSPRDSRASAAAATVSG